MKRRFKLEKELIYDRFYDFYRINSPVLNQANVASISTELNDRQGLLWEIIKLNGDDKGEYVQHGDIYIATIPSIKRKLDEVDKAFQSYCKKRANEGYPVPDKLTPEMHELQMQLMARLDIYMEEFEDLKRRLKMITDTEKKIEDDHILMYGLMGSGKLLDGILVTLDGQKIIQNDNGLLIANGPYKGMAVKDYRVLCDRWRADRKMADQKKLLELQEQAKKSGRPIPVSLGVSSPKRVSKANLPEFPKEFKKHEI